MSCKTFSWEPRVTAVKHWWPVVHKWTKRTTPTAIKDLFSNWYVLCSVPKGTAARKHVVWRWKCRANPFRPAVEIVTTNSHHHGLPLGVVLWLCWWPSTSAPWRGWRVMAARRHGNWGPRNTPTCDLQGTCVTTLGEQICILELIFILHMSFECVYSTM